MNIFSGSMKKDEQPKGNSEYKQPSEDLKIEPLKPKLKHKLEIEQTKEELRIEGALAVEDYTVDGLWLFPRGQQEGFLVEQNWGTNNFQFVVSLNEMMQLTMASEVNTFDWFIEVTVPFDILSEKKRQADSIKISEKDNQKFASYYMRLGRFQYTNFKGTSFHYLEDNYSINYITTKGNISFVVNGEPPTVPIKINIDRIHQQESGFGISGMLFTKSSLINSGELILRGRESLEELKFDQSEFTHLDDPVENSYGNNRYMYTSEIEFNRIDGGEALGEEVYDFYFKLNLNNRHEPIYVRIGAPVTPKQLFAKDMYLKSSKEFAVLNPYYTFKHSNLSLEVFKFPRNLYGYLRRTIRWSKLIRKLFKNKDLWLVGERTYKAQDTGFAFFKYMRTQHPDKQVYYVIEKDSPERKNVEKYGNVLEYKSKKHIWKTIIAKKIISSHHPDYLYPIRTPSFKANVEADKVFLQHGVMGTKNMVANYGKNAIDFDTDFFIVSSDSEKEMIVRDFGYNPKDVFVTGLSRFDTLFETDVTPKKQVFIIPTWRDWIVTEDTFIESEYYKRYKELIHSEALHELAEVHGFNIVLSLHPNMQQFSKFFKHDNVQINIQGEIDVQHLIKESALMITDYSSVAFDFSFLHKPVIYYQFDRKAFIGKRDSHLDLENELPGEICYEHEELLMLLEEYATNQFQMKEDYRVRADRFIKYRDQKSSERIYEVINGNEAKRS